MMRHRGTHAFDYNLYKQYLGGTLVTGHCQSTKQTCVAPRTYLFSKRLVNEGGVQG